MLCYAMLYVILHAISHYCLCCICHMSSTQAARARPRGCLRGTVGASGAFVGASGAFWWEFQGVAGAVQAFVGASGAFTGACMTASFVGDAVRPCSQDGHGQL